MPKLETLSQRALNRALLARQLLLERAGLTPEAAVGQLFAMQAQLARPPLIGLWSRLAGTTREAMLAAVHDKRLVRATSLRATLHLMTAQDYMAFRAAIAPVLAGALSGVLKQRKVALEDLAALVAEAREALATGPKTFEAVRRILAATRPDADERALGYAVRMQLPLVLVPTDAAWGWPGDPAFTTARAWLGAEPAEEAALGELVRRYLRAFGPATPKDMQVWSGLGGLKGAFAALRDELVVFRDEAGRELFDLPGAPRPDPETPAPVRLLADFDGLVLGHDDRTRVIADEHRARLYNKANLRWQPFFLVDGFVAGAWRLEARATAKLVLTPFMPLAAAAREALAAEAEALARFAEPGAKRHEVVFEAG